MVCVIVPNMLPTFFFFFFSDLFHRLSPLDPAPLRLGTKHLYEFISDARQGCGYRSAWDFTGDFDVMIGKSMIVSDKLCRHVIFLGPISWWFMCLIVYHCWSYTYESYTYESYTYSLYNLMGSQASSSEADEACWGNNPDLLEKLGVDTWGFPARHGGPQGSPKMLGVSGEISSFEMDVDKGKSWGVPSFEQCPSSSCWLMLVGSGIIHYPSSIGDSFHTPRTRNPEKNAAQYDGTIFRDDWGYIPMIPMAFRNIWTSVRLALHPKGNSPRLLTLDPHHPNLPIYIISIYIYT